MGNGMTGYFVRDVNGNEYGPYRTQQSAVEDAPRILGTFNDLRPVTRSYPTPSDGVDSRLGVTYLTKTIGFERRVGEQFERVASIIAHGELSY